MQNASSIYTVRTPYRKKELRALIFEINTSPQKFTPPLNFLLLHCNAAERVCAQLHIKHLRIKRLICLKTPKVQKVRYDNASFERQQILLF